MHHPTSDGSKSWIKIPADSDFSIHNIPFGIFRSGRARAGVAIGDHVIDLQALHENGLLKGLNLKDGIFSRPTLNDFFSGGRKQISSVRNRIIELVSEGNEELKSNNDLVSRALLRQKEVELLMPVEVKNYSDFYSSEEHARNVGSMFRDPKNALLPNWKHMPVAYHGRASSIVVSGTPIRRPKGQLKDPDSEYPFFGPSRKLDLEVEMAFITCGETALGDSISADRAEDFIAGFVLFNDWSARDIQQWEYVPLGPFLGKNFGSTISPWVVTLDALEPFRCQGPRQDPDVLPYLRVSGPRNFDVAIETILETKSAGATIVCRTNMKYLYWCINQQLAHHTVNGCNIQVGDMYASGTISGPSPGSYGSMLELTWNGKRVLTMPDGTVRTFLEDGDSVVMRAFASQNGMRVGFGECRGKILPAL